MGKKKVETEKERVQEQVIEMTEAEMKQYTAAELELMMPRRWSKYGYWRRSKDSDAWKVIVHDWKAVMR